MDGTTLLDDTAAIDTLTGGSPAPADEELDWFFHKLGAADTVTDLEAGELDTEF